MELGLSPAILPKILAEDLPSQRIMKRPDDTLEQSDPEIGHRARRNHSGRRILVYSAFMGQPFSLGADLFVLRRLCCGSGFVAALSFAPDRVWRGHTLACALRSHSQGA